MRFDLIRKKFSYFWKSRCKEQFRLASDKLSKQIARCNFWKNQEKNVKTKRYWHKVTNVTNSNLRENRQAVQSSWISDCVCMNLSPTFFVGFGNKRVWEDSPQVRSLNLLISIKKHFCNTLDEGWLKQIKLGVKTSTGVSIICLSGILVSKFKTKKWLDRRADT